MALNLTTIAPDAPFLDELVKAVLDGFPLPPGQKRPLLSRWTILVPNRRAATALREKFLDRAKLSALLLPRIKPIGDLDDDFFDDDGGPIELQDALTPVARQFSLVRLIGEWISAHPHLMLAQALARSAPQVHALARSLAALMDSLEIEEQPLSALRDAFDIDLASHREAIVSLLALLHHELPALQMAEGKTGKNERRGRLIKLNVEALKNSPLSGPIIAAGSTGTIPATRMLLKAIAELPHGAVVLPGLDTTLDEESWNAVSPQHPQFALKQLLQDLDADHRSIPVLGPATGDRGWLGAEMMRPSETTDVWAKLLPAARGQTARALAGVELVECDDTIEEARTIAVIMRMALEEQQGTVALLTPDRALARRVKSALARWNITPEDSAGEPLSASGVANFIGLLTDLVQEPQSIAALAAILHHPLARFGRTAGEIAIVASQIDITLLRSPLMMLGLAQLPQLVDMLPQAMKQDFRVHAAAVEPGGEGWKDLVSACLSIHGILVPLLSRHKAVLAQHLDVLLSVARQAVAEEAFLTPAAEELLQLIEELKAESSRLPELQLPEAASLLRLHLDDKKHHPARAVTPRISILGLLEARLLHFDTVILGGLTENIWPGQADTGPWLNRPMRELLKVKQPEATIGQMAHDLLQTMGAGQLILTSAKRDGGKPLNPSRWLLRLRTVLSAAGVAPPAARGAEWKEMARLIDMPRQPVRVTIPAPCPPAASRLNKLSITQVDKLIRDPYAVYAQNILKLSPLDEMDQDENYSLRGQIIHLALAKYFKMYHGQAPDNLEAALLDCGELAFSLLPPSSVVSNFWWPRYKRIAAWFAANGHEFHVAGAKLLAEAKLQMPLRAVGADFELTGRADLIRIHDDGSATIFDFKTGTVPPVTLKGDNFSYQLTIEAAMLENGALKDYEQLTVGKLHYVQVSGFSAARRIQDHRRKRNRRSGLPSRRS